MAKGIVDPKRVLTAAGFTDTQQLHKSKHWAAWQGKFETPVSEFHRAFLFLNASCGWSHLKDARAWLLRNRRSLPLTVVSSNFLVKVLTNEGRDKVAQHLDIESEKVKTQAEFLFQVLEKTLSTPAGLVDESDDPGQKYFIEPSLRGPLTSEKEEPALNTLTSWLAGRMPNHRTAFGVLLGDAGVGKSTVSRQLFSRLSSTGYRVIPLLIESRQWAGISMQGWLDLEDIWKAAVSTCYPGAMIGPERLESFLASGTVVPILDGFDELCTLYPGSFNPGETVGLLRDLCDEGNFLLTSRRRFWSEHMGIPEGSSVYNFDLEPFNIAQRDAYVKKRFPGDKKKAKSAVAILERIRQRTFAWSSGELGVESARPKALDTIPFVVMLATESADTEDGDVAQQYGQLLSSKDPLEGLLLAFCERERVRQKVSLQAEQQVEVFRILASELDEPFSLEDLELAVALNSSSTESSLTEFVRHDLLEVDRSRPEIELYRIKFQFLREYLIGRALMLWFDGDLEMSGVLAALRKCALRQSSLVEQAASLLRRNVQDWRDELKVRWHELPSAERFARIGMLLLCATMCRESSKTGEEASRMLLDLLGDPGEDRFENILWSGSYSGFDFRGISFVRCVFDNVEFSQCRFDEGVVFEECSFRGALELVHCTDFGLTRILENCHIASERARAAIQREMKDQSSFPVTEEQVTVALQDTIRRFRRGYGFATRKVEGVRSSAKNRWVFADQVLDELVRFGVLEVFESHGKEMYKVKDREAVIAFLDNGAAIRSIKRAFDRLNEKLR